MPETLTELVAKIKADSGELEKGLTDAERKTEASSKKMQDSLKKVGTVMAASGAAITAALGLMGKAAIDEEINMKRLATTINNSGTAYDNVKDSLEAVIAATQRKTGIADDEQRDVLNRLILVTNDYDKALELLPTALDLASAGEIDAATAATYLGKAYLDLENGADSVSVRFGQASLQFKNMEDIQNRVAGAAVNLANPLNILKATIGDVAESIGSFLIPTIKDLVNKFAAVSDGIQNWIKLNPELVEQLVLSTAKLGLLLLTIGSLILIFPKVIEFILILTELLGPWGWAVLAVSALIGYLVAELLGLTRVMVGIKDIMADVEKQMFIMRAEQALSAEEWAKIKEQGYLTEQQFINLAKAMKLTTEELYNQMEASGMLQETMTSIGDTNVYLAETINKTADSADNAAKTFDPTLSNALNKVNAGTNNLTDRFADLMRELQFAETEAGKLHLTMDDVYTAMYKLGYKTEQISEVFKKYGNITEIDEDLLDDLGLTAEEVAKLVGKLKEETDKGTESFKQYGEEAQKSAEKVASAWGANLADIKASKALPSGEGRLSLGEYIASKEGTAEVYGRMAEGGISKRQAISDMQKEVYGFGLPGYAQGGIVPGAIGQPVLATVHGGETIIPANESMGNVVVNFTQPVFFDREDTMNRFVDMIRKGVQRQDRLRFGGAYSG